MRFRIIEETEKSGKKYYYIQKRKFIFWSYLFENPEPSSCIPSIAEFDSYKDAVDHIEKIEQIEKRRKSKPEQRVIKKTILPYLPGPQKDQHVLENNPINDVLYKQKDGNLASLVCALEENKNKAKNSSIITVFKIKNDPNKTPFIETIVDIADIENEPDYRYIVVQQEDEKLMGEIGYKVHIDDIYKYNIVKGGRILMYISGNELGYQKPPVK